jgi:hypothetical protein
VSYTPGAAGAPSSTDTIIAVYGGDSTHASSGDTTAVTVPPPSAADCHHGGWRDHGFVSQGDCVAFVATKGKNEPGKNIPTPKEP